QTRRRADAQARRSARRTSAGPRPRVALHGPADPARTERARAGVDVTAAMLQAQQRQAAAADFGEHAVAPVRQPVALDVASRVQMPEPALAQTEAPTVSDDLASALDQTLAPTLQARMRAARQEAEARSARMDGEMQEVQSRTRALLAQSTESARAESASAQARAEGQVAELRTQWRAQADTIGREHSAAAHDLQQARLARSEQVVTSGEERVAGTLTRAEQQCDSERTSAEARAARIMADAHAQAASASQQDSTGVMRQEDEGDEVDGMAILADAEASAQEALAQAEALIQQLIDAAQRNAQEEVFALQGQIDALFADLGQELGGMMSLLEARMPLVAESFTARIDALIASVDDQVRVVETAMRSGQSDLLQDMEDNLSTRMAEHQQGVADIFDDVMHDWRVVETAEDISARCMSGECFERDENGNLIMSESGSLPIANLTPAEYLILFEAVEIQTGVPAELLQAIAHGEAVGSGNTDNVPRQFVQEDYLVDPGIDGYLGGRALDGMEWFGAPIPVGVDAGGTYGLGIMQHTFHGDVINGVVPDALEGEDLYAAMLAQAGDANRSDAYLGGFVDVNISRSIVDPYYNIMMAAELLKQQTASFINEDSPYFDLIAPDIDTYPDRTRNGDAFYGEGPDNLVYPSSYDADTEHDAWGLSIIAGFYNGAYSAADFTDTDDANWGYADNIFNNMTDPNNPAYAFSNAEPIVSSDSDIPIPQDYATVDGQLYRFTPQGLVPAESNTIEIDGAEYTFDEASGELVPAGGE
ncbi:MAG TPA: hypothetical protein VNM90_30995, partial [Haliangium sp.]|nr:hypothetical protein [Haliangium sp.]